LVYHDNFTSYGKVQSAVVTEGSGLVELLCEYSTGESRWLRVRLKAGSIGHPTDCCRYTT
jgi:hypothetical protein